MPSQRCFRLFGFCFIAIVSACGSSGTGGLADDIAACSDDIVSAVERSFGVTFEERFPRADACGLATADDLVVSVATMDPTDPDGSIFGPLADVVTRDGRQFSRYSSSPSAHEVIVDDACGVYLVVSALDSFESLPGLTVELVEAAAEAIIAGSCGT